MYNPPPLGSVLRQGRHHTKQEKCAGQRPHAPASVLWVGQRSRIHPDGAGLEQPQCLDVYTAVTLPGSRRKQFGAMGADTITPQALVGYVGSVFQAWGQLEVNETQGFPTSPTPHIAADLRRVQTYVQEGSCVAM